MRKPHAIVSFSGNSGNPITNGPKAVYSAAELAKLRQQAKAAGVTVDVQHQ